MAKYSSNSYLENSLQKLNVNYLTGAENRLWPRWGGENITVAYNKFYYILNGNFHFEINGKTYEGKPGQMYLLPYNARTSYHAYDDANARKMWIHFTMSCGEKDFFETVDINPFIVVENPEYVEELFRTIFRCGKHGSVSNILEVKASILKLVAYYLDTSEVSFPDLILDERFEKVIKYIDTHISEEIRLKDLAQLMYLNSNYFIKFFKRNVGMSPIEYILKTRVNYAKQYLQTSNMQIKDIASKCGFATVYYFDRVFKRYTGFTPSFYRSMALVAPTDGGGGFKLVRPTGVSAPPKEVTLAQQAEKKTKTKKSK